jgi:hypothetical protein
VSNFIVDAALLACPDPSRFPKNDFQEIFKTYLSRLVDVALLRANCKSIRFWRDDGLSAVLQEQDCYPFRHSLNQAFSQLFDPEDFQIEDVNLLTMTLLDRSLSLEDFGDIKEISVSACSIIDDPVHNRNKEFLEYLCHVIALAVPVLGNKNEFHPNTYLASTGSDKSTEYLIANYTVDIAEYSDGSYSEVSEKKSVKIAGYRGAVSYFEGVDLAAWWSTATEQAVIDVCGVYAALTVLQGSAWHTLGILKKAISLGKEFIPSAQRLGFMHEPAKILKLIRVCVDLSFGKNLSDSHWLRAGMGPNEPQRKRGDWRAWRHDIDYEFHLHYWRNGDRVEIANVVVHNDFKIS